MFSAIQRTGSLFLIGVILLAFTGPEAHARGPFIHSGSFMTPSMMMRPPAFGMVHQPVTGSPFHTRPFVPVNNLNNNFMPFVPVNRFPNNFFRQDVFLRRNLRFDRFLLARE